MRRFLAVCAALATLFELSACGGGGGGGGSSPSNSLTFSVSTNTANFSAASITQPPPGQMSVTGTVTGSARSPAGILYIVVTVPSPNIATVSNFQISGNSGQASIVPGSPATLGAGSYTETLTVKACLNDPTCASGELQGSPQTITVNYTITGVASTSSTLTYSIGNAPTSTSFADTFQVSGYPAQSWSATSNVPWLSLTPASGSTTAPMSVSAALDQGQVNALDGGTYTGTVTLTPTTGAPVTIPVSLTVARTQVNYVAPYVAIAGTTGNVIIRGEHFSLVTPTAINFGTATASSFTVVSDTEIHATYPALPAGTYTVHIVNALGVDRTTAQLSVIDTTAFTATNIQFPTTDDPLSVVYDAPRQALLVSLGSGTVLRYAYSAGWGTPTSVTLPGGSLITESVDGTVIVATYLDPTSNHLTVAELDPVTLATRKQVSETNWPFPLTGSTMAASNNGHVIINAADTMSADDWPFYDYSLLNGSLTPIGGSTLPARANLAVSLDGSTLLAQTWNGLDDTDTQQYDSNQDMMVPAAAQVSGSNVTLNRDGSRALFFTLSTGQVTINDAGLNLLGTLPLTTNLNVFGPISGHVYCYDGNVIRIFDVSQAVGATFSEITPALTPIQIPSEVYTIAITPDEEALFLAGNAGIVVVPLH